MDEKSCVTPAGTYNELDVQNEWEENTHTINIDILEYQSCTYINIEFLQSFSAPSLTEITHTQIAPEELVYSY